MSYSGSRCLADQTDQYPHRVIAYGFPVFGYFKAHSIHDGARLCRAVQENTVGCEAFRHFSE
jgi:hypothetical protein